MRFISLTLLCMTLLVTSSPAEIDDSPILPISRDCSGSILFHSYQSVTFIDYYEIQDDPGTVDGPSNWYVDGNGWLRESSNIYGDDDIFPEMNGTRAYIADECWSDFILQVQVNPHDNDGWGIYFRTSAEDSSATGYRAFFSRELGVGEYLQKRVDGEWITLDENLTPTYLEDQWQLLEILAHGDALSVKIDGNVILSANDNTYVDGQVAFFSRGMNYLAWDNLLVSNVLGGQIDPFVDAVPYSEIQPGNNGNDNDDPNAMVGMPDGTYTSLGGDCAGNPGIAMAILDMGAGEEVIADGPGYDFEILEVGAIDGGVDEPFEVYVGDSEDGPWDFMGVGNSDSYFDLADIGRCTARFIKLIDISTLTCNSGGVPGSDIDGVVAFYLGPPPDPAPPVIAVSLSGEDILLDWNAVPYAVTYNIYLLTGPYQAPGWIFLASTAGTSWTDVEATIGNQQRYYRVTAAGCE
jgi:hypothetical protein